MTLFIVIEATVGCALVVASGALFGRAWWRAFGRRGVWRFPLSRLMRASAR
jgi:hypothetical protein